MGTLKTEDGLCVEGEALDDHVMEYFQSLFSASKDKGPREFLNNLGERVIAQMKENLSKNFTAKELKDALN